MKAYLLSLAVGLLVGVVYALFQVRPHVFGRLPECRPAVPDQDTRVERAVLRGGRDD